MPPALDALIRDCSRKTLRPVQGIADDVGRALESLGAESSPLLSEPRPRAYLYRPPFTGSRGAPGSARQRAGARPPGRREDGVPERTGAAAAKTRLLMELGRLARRSGLHVRSRPSVCPPGQAGAAGPGAADLSARSVRSSSSSPIAARAGGPEMTRKLLGAHTRVLAEHEPSLLGVPGSEGHPAPVALSPRDAGRTGPARGDRGPVGVGGADLHAARDRRPPVGRRSEPGGALPAGTRSPRGAVRAGAQDLPERRGPSGRDQSAAWRPSRRLSAAPAARRAGRGAHRRRNDRHGEAPPALSGFLAEQSGGSPLFVSEHLKAAVAEGILVRREGLWGLSGEDAGGRYSARGGFRPRGAAGASAASRR